MVGTENGRVGNKLNKREKCEKKEDWPGNPEGRIVASVPHVGLDQGRFPIPNGIEEGEVAG